MYSLRNSKLASRDSVELRTFYSSQCICNLGHSDCQLCSKQSCGICNAVKSSFKTFAFGASHDTGKYAKPQCSWFAVDVGWYSLGEGIYSNLNPAKADQLATSCTSSPYRVMVLCDVQVMMVRKFQVLPLRRVELTKFYPGHWQRTSIRQQSWFYYCAICNSIYEIISSFVFVQK